MTTVINFIGGPGAGKSTLAAELFGYMKKNKFDVEYVDEYAKHLTWEENKIGLEDQILIFGQQHHKLYMMLDKVDYIITDSPLLLSIFYTPKALTKFKKGYAKDALAWLATHTYDQYNNKLIYVNRGIREYIQTGRNENEREARTIDQEILNYLTYRSYDFMIANDLNDVLKGLCF